MATQARRRDRQRYGKFIEADRATVLDQHKRYWESQGGLPSNPAKVRRTVCEGLTYQSAVRYLSQINQRILEGRAMLSAMVLPFVVAWYPELGESLGFPIEVWMVKGERPGRWDVVENSSPLYSLPWLFGYGWVIEGWRPRKGVADRPPV